MAMISLASMLARVSFAAPPLRRPIATMTIGGFADSAWEAETVGALIVNLPRREVHTATSADTIADAVLVMKERGVSPEAFQEAAADQAAGKKPAAKTKSGGKAKKPAAKKTEAKAKKSAKAKAEEKDKSEDAKSGGEAK